MAIRETCTVRLSLAGLGHQNGHQRDLYSQTIPCRSRSSEWQSERPVQSDYLHSKLDGHFLNSFWQWYNQTLIIFMIKICVTLNEALKPEGQGKTKLMRDAFSWLRQSPCQIRQLSLHWFSEIQLVTDRHTWHRLLGPVTKTLKTNRRKKMRFVKDQSTGPIQTIFDI